MQKYVAQELLEKIDNPLIFKGLKAAPKQDILGYDISILADVCDAIINEYADKIYKNC